MVISLQLHSMLCLENWLSMTKLVKAEKVSNLCDMHRISQFVQFLLFFFFYKPFKGRQIKPSLSVHLHR